MHAHLSLNFYEQFQSSFHSCHSTNTDIVKITNNLLMAADSGLLTILILLDLNAALDTTSPHMTSFKVNEFLLEFLSLFLPGFKHISLAALVNSVKEVCST